MMVKRSKWMRGVAAGLLMTAGLVVWRELPSWAAYGLLHPFRRTTTTRPARLVEDVQYKGDGVTLQGWRFAAEGDRRGTVVYLHGIADNRSSAAGPADQFVRRGFDVVAYDSRAHGESGGLTCTYGYYEKLDLQRVLDTIETGPIVVMGNSLGAAVALQAAADDGRIDGVIAVETFSDLRTVALERAPFFLTHGMTRRAFAIAEAAGGFEVDAVSPVRAAAGIKVPVLLIHGARDRETPPEHSGRVFRALSGPKRLLVVDGAGHNRSLAPSWPEIHDWMEEHFEGGGR
jgi:alpha-beta hydrolase superfamily lysophospholipase